MPELPDILAYIRALDERIAGRRLVRTVIAKPFLLRTADPPLAETEGRLVHAVRRVGKRIAIGLEGDLWLVIHLMVAGRFQWSDAAIRPGRDVLASLLFAHGTLTLTEAGSKHRASLHVLRGEAALADMDAGGIDVFAAGEQTFREVLSRENHTLKRALTDPRLLSGIGNAYSDEILHAAKLSPLALTQKLDAQQWSRFYLATTQTLRMWVDRLVAEAGAEFPRSVTAFRADMAVHGRFRKPCPVCGTPIARIRYADNETNYCPSCQTGGKLLADRAFSRVLGRDWAQMIGE